MKDNRPLIAGEPTYYSGLDDLSKKSEAEKVAWFRGRFDKIIIRPLQEVRAVGPANERLWDLNLGVVTIICSAVEALGSFYLPTERSDRVKFIRFVEDFMNPRYRESSTTLGETYATILYEKFRCGLAHGLSIEGHEVATRPAEYISDEKGYISIDLWSLFEDMEQALEVYLAAVAADASVRGRFTSRFNEIFVGPYAGKA